MLANAKYIYALDMLTVEKRPNGWYFSKSAYHGNKYSWRGPYAAHAPGTLAAPRHCRYKGTVDVTVPPRCHDRDCRNH
jgi:hypothetical protein